MKYKVLTLGNFGTKNVTIVTEQGTFILYLKQLYSGRFRGPSAFSSA